MVVQFVAILALLHGAHRRPRYHGIILLGNHGSSLEVIVTPPYKPLSLSWLLSTLTCLTRAGSSNQMTNF